jgi:hypothetical protein
MAQFGEIRVDFITYTTGVSPSEGSVTLPVSGLVNSPTFSGDVSVSGIFTANTINVTTLSGTTISGDVVKGAIVSGATVTGDAVVATTITGGTISGVTITAPTVTTSTGLFASGSAATPSITFIGDTDVGLFTGAANTLSFTTSGTRWWTLSGDGSFYTFSSGAFQVPTGTTAARPTTGLTGMIRYNSTLAQYEGYSQDAWALLGGGATGSGGDRVFVLNEQNVTTNYTLPSGNNATSCGPITIDDGVEVIVGDDQNWAIV